MSQTNFKSWIEAMRLRTLPVSAAGVLAGWIVAYTFRSFQLLPALICLIFALGAQIASNFANEYFDFANGLDKKGREGFRRGVTEGDIKPKSMLYATITLLALISLIGLSLVYWGGWWLIPIGVVIAVGALAYSAGPYPLSHHGLGDIAVIIFFGIIPVSLTAYVQLPDWNTLSTSSLCNGLRLWEVVLPVSIGVGMLAANVLIVNNVRDVNDDQAVNKHTTAVILGIRIMSVIYLVFGYAGIFLIAAPFWLYIPTAARVVWIIPIIFILRLQTKLRTLKGSPLNNVLKNTSLLLFGVIILLATEVLICL